MLQDTLIEELEKFNIHELFFIKNNLKLGKDHLFKKIGEDEFNNLLSMIKLSSEKKSKLTLSIEAKIGYFIFFYNIILTTLLGIAFGFSGLFGSGKFKICPLIIIFLLSAIISLFVTWLNSKHIKKKNSQILKDQKIAELELKIIQMIINKGESKIKRNQKKLLNITENILQKIHSILPSDVPIHLDQCLSELGYFRQISQKESFPINIEPYFKKYQTHFTFHSLAHLRSYSMESPLKIKKWLATNWGDVIPTTFITLFGSFSSAFILYNNVPLCIQESGYIFQWEQFVHSKHLLILISILIASYFTFSHAKFMYTNYIKENSLKQLANKISALEMKYLYRKSQNNFLLENLSRARRLVKYVNRIISKKTLIMDKKIYATAP